MWSSDLIYPKRHFIFELPIFFQFSNYFFLKGSTYNFFSAWAQDETNMPGSKKVEKAIRPQWLQQKCSLYCRRMQFICSQLWTRWETWYVEGMTVYGQRLSQEISLPEPLCVPCHWESQVWKCFAADKSGCLLTLLKKFKPLSIIHFYTLSMNRWKQENNEKRKN